MEVRRGYDRCMDLLDAVLVVDDDCDVLEAARLALFPYVVRIETITSPATVGDLVRATEFDCVLLDMNYEVGKRAGDEGMDLLQQIKTADPAVGIVLMTAYGAISLAVEGLKQGADDFLLKPWRNKNLVESVQQAAARTRSARELATLDVVERSVISRALVRHEGNIAQAASSLGLSRPALYRRMAKHGL